MLIVGSTAAAYPLMLGAMVFLGTWPNGFKLCASVRVELLYLSFAIGFLMVGIGGPFIFGNVGATEPDFFVELTHMNGVRVFFALLGGFILSCGNELYCFGAAHVGLTIALFVQGGLGILLGSAINYLIDPSGASPGFLFSGVAASFVAVIFSTLASITRDKHFEQVRTLEMAVIDICDTTKDVPSMPQSDTAGLGGGDTDTPPCHKEASAHGSGTAVPTLPPVRSDARTLQHPNEIELTAPIMQGMEKDICAAPTAPPDPRDMSLEKDTDDHIDIDSPPPKSAVRGVVLCVVCSQLFSRRCSTCPPAPASLFPLGRRRCQHGLHFFFSQLHSQQRAGFSTFQF